VEIEGFSMMIPSHEFSMQGPYKLNGGVGSQAIGPMVLMFETFKPKVL
jgi:hypothetical protein